ncbi:hypothetical protein Ngar_c18560 [Candidatus Nitrososphaera gargensis Ga9.2]|uniref:GtrA-like protein domain-containing protein n=1 Tax=Nitrososphaera gargensis (strain Ga9.2) TaxID=1237085 RepID=K0IIF4_NITGG|nr:hypothetical protein [Candidatus Nitrososphaera gargensis]AFU58788.1 hypothetical protein Ngar_c18560 [Candidatus Nitrososphaera gargensis Ga9.2]
MSVKKVISKDRVKEYMIVTLVSHIVGQLVFLPWNLYVMNFTPEQFLRGAIASIPIAFIWNYAGIKVNLYCSYKVKSFVENVATRKH